MYKRCYLPELFERTLDGIDRTNEIVATYYMDDEVPGSDFADHFELLETLILQGSTGTWEENIEEDNADLRRKLTGRLVGYYEVPSDRPSRRCAVVQLSFPIDAWDDNVAMMLLSIAGNWCAMSPKSRLLDVAFPENLLANFKGPKFGVPGVREMTGIYDRPLSLHIIKPKMGMTPEQTANQCYQTAVAGVDMMKDDEMCTDVYNCKYDDRLKAVLEALDKASDKTGKKPPIYFLSITDEPRRIFDKAAHAVELGATGLLVCYSAGLPVLRQLAEDPAINVPILLHAAHMIAAQPRISWPVFAKLVRLCGADLMLTPFRWGSMPMVSIEECVRTAQVKLAPLGHIKPIWPMPCAGVYPGLTPVMVAEYGPDIVIPAGGGMLGHPDGYGAGAKAWQQAIAATMSDEDFIECAKKPENKELRRALEKWGYFERPSTPWMRVVHPTPMQFDD